MQACQVVLRTCDVSESAWQAFQGKICSLKPHLLTEHNRFVDMRLPKVLTGAFPPGGIIQLQGDIFMYVGTPKTYALNWGGWMLRIWLNFASHLREFACELKAPLNFKVFPSTR